MAAYRWRSLARDKIERLRHGKVEPKKFGTRRPFATIPTTSLATRRVRSLPGSAIRLLLWMEACWVPVPGPVPAGCVVVPQHKVARALRLRPSTVREAVARLLDAELAVLKCAAVRPGGMGGGKTGRGQAAEYDLPHRHVGSVVPCYDQGDKRMPGYLKMWCDDLRNLAGRLSDAAARVLMIAAAIPRTSDGTMLNRDEAIDLTGAQLASVLPGLNQRTASRAVFR